MKLGDEVTMETRRGRKPVLVQGVLTGVRLSGSTISDAETGERYTGVQYQLTKPDGATVWSVTFPDRDGAWTVERAQ